MFGRRKRAKSAGAGSWTVAEGTVSGEPVLVRFDARYRGGSSQQRTALPFRIGVAVPFDGQLQADDHQELHAIEDRVAAAMELRGAALVAVITQRQFREFVLYAPTAEWALEVHDQLRREFPNRTIQMHAAEDPCWSLYDNITTRPELPI